VVVFLPFSCITHVKVAIIFLILVVSCLFYAVCKHNKPDVWVVATDKFNYILHCMVEIVNWNVCLLNVNSVGVRVNYIHRTLVRCRYIFVFLLHIIPDSSNTVYISFPVGQEANDEVWQWACHFVDTCIFMENGEWPSVWSAEILDTLQYTVMFSVTPIRCDFLFTVQGSITTTEPTSGWITVMLCMSPLWYHYNWFCTKLTSAVIFGFPVCSTCSGII